MEKNLNFFCAASIASILNIDLENIGLVRKVLWKKKDLNFEYNNNNIVINDTYNANPNSMLNALR
ncbi:hypothetical protein CM15mP43_02360 [bacterium]|nr:MAG: hypothetical protein CM15mP43_02360 [bacterium]